MKLTKNLNLPIYNDPERDMFDLTLFNNANESIDSAYEEVKNTSSEITDNFNNTTSNIVNTFNSTTRQTIDSFNEITTDITNNFNESVSKVEDIFEEIPKVNANAEVIDARGGEATLGDKVRKINSQLDDKAPIQYVDTEIAKAQLEGAGIDTSGFATKQDVLPCVNIFNKANAHIGGGLLSQTVGSVYGTSITTNVDYFYSELISINAGVEYKVIPYIQNVSDFASVYTLIYDSQKKLIRVVNGKLPVFTCDTNEKYVAIMGRNSLVSTIMCVYDTFPTKYINYGVYKDVDVDKKGASKLNIINKQSVFVGYQLKGSATNPFDFNTVSSVTTSCVYKKENNKISIFNNRANSLYFKKWNSLLNTVSEVVISPNAKIVIDISDCEYIQFVGVTDFEKTLTVIWGDVAIDRYIDESELYLNLKEINDLKAIISGGGKLSGKKIVFDGDSITAGAGALDITAGISPNNNKGWGYNIQQLNPSSICYGYGQSGWRVGRFSSSDTQSLLDHVSQYPSEVDYFVLSGGYNDMAQQMALGTLTKPSDGNNAYYGVTFDEYTFIGALESWFKQIRVKYPMAKIMYVLTPRRNYNGTAVFNNDSKGNKVKDVLYSTGYERMDVFWNAIIEVCKKWSIPYIDFRYDGQIVGSAETNSTVDSVYYNTSTNDLTHPNAFYYSYVLAPLIDNKLNQI